MSVARRRDLKLCALALLIMIGFAELQLAAPDVPWIRRLELVALDLRQRLQGRSAPGPETIIVLVDERAIAELGRWPLPRRRFAELVDFLHQAGAKVVGIDVLFAEPEPSPPGEPSGWLARQPEEQDPEGAAVEMRRTAGGGDNELARAMREAGNVVLPFSFRFGGAPTAEVPPYIAKSAFRALRIDPRYRPVALNPSSILAPIPVLGNAAAALGHTLIVYDIDGAPRYDYPVIDYDLDYYPSMAVRIAQLFRGLPWDEVSAELGRRLMLGAEEVPTDSSSRLLVSYIGPPRSFPTYSFASIAAGELPQEIFRDRIVLIGTSILGAADRFRSPFSAVLPGVERLATVVDSLLHDRQLRRPFYAPWIEVSWMLVAALLIGLAVSRLAIVLASLVAAALPALWLVAGQLALQRYGLWYAAVLPTVATVLTFTLVILYRHGLLDREHRRVRHAFQRYLSPKMVEQLANSRKPPELGGELRELTVLFCDLRGFTGLSERLQARELTRMVNEFFGAATEAVIEQGGTIDKYLGDAVMAFWNAPLEQPAHAELACRAALGILDRLERLNSRLAPSAGLGPLASGIGINTGLCTVGNFGSSHRFDYSAIGDAVNIAARLEALTKGFGITVALGPETAARVPMLATLPLASIPLRGRSEALEISALIGDEALSQTPAFAALRQKHLNFRAALRQGHRDAALRLQAELRREAPASLARLYEVLGEPVTSPG